LLKVTGKVRKKATLMEAYNRSVMPFDVSGRTRATMAESTSSMGPRTSDDTSQTVNPMRAWEGKLIYWNSGQTLG